MNENKEKIRLDRTKIITNAITASIAIVISFVVITCLVIVLKPILTDENSSKSQINTNSTEMSKYMDRIRDAISRVSSKYVDDVNMEELVDGAVSGIASATGDPYTRYIDEEEYKEMLTSGTEIYGGIGVHLTYDKESDGILVLGVMQDSPALKVDIKAGDTIIKVEDIVVSYDTYRECVDKIKGEKGTSVSIILKRKDEIIEKKVERDNVTTNNVTSDVLESNIGYIKIWSFDNDIYKQFKESYDSIKAKNVSGLIIDLRNNPGGIVSDTVEIAKQLLPKCDIVRLVYKDGSEKVYKSDGKNEINIPLVVLVNSRSASAAEILSGAIKDSQKGILIGNKTYGKGIVQMIEPLGNRGALSITTSKYYTASGTEIHKNGIEPNMVVDLPEDVKDDIAVPKDKDTQLQKAIEYINSKK